MCILAHTLTRTLSPNGGGGEVGVECVRGDILVRGVWLQSPVVVVVEVVVVVLLGSRHAGRADDEDEVGASGTSNVSDAVAFACLAKYPFYIYLPNAGSSKYALAKRYHRTSHTLRPRSSSSCRFVGRRLPAMCSGAETTRKKYLKKKGPNHLHEYERYLRTSMRRIYY